MSWFRGNKRTEIVVDDMGVRRVSDDRLIEGVRWADLVRVEIRTLPTGPFGDDVLWVLVSADNTGAVVPSEVAPDGFLERLQQLPGFDNAAVIQAMKSTDDAVFRCWTRSSADWRTG